MKRSVPAWQLSGFLFTAVAGTLLHFSFDWTGGNWAAGLFSAVNESIWEHLKLLFYPMILFAATEYYALGQDIPGFWCTKLLGILFGLVLIPVLYYTYTGISGISVDWLNIAIFFFAAGAVFWLETQLLTGNYSCPLGRRISLLLLLLLAVSFTVLTFQPPHIPLFRDPLTGTYGY